MMSQTVWGPLEVHKFFQDFNWLGKPAQLEPLESDTETQEQTSWLCLRVQDFLQQSNWRGEKVIKPKEQSFPETPTLSLTMSVGQFFQFAQWRNSQPLAMIPETKTKPKPVSSESPEMNLTDLSDLF